MRKHRFTDEQLRWLRNGYRVALIPELTEQFNARFGLQLRPSQVLAATKNHKMKSGRDGRFKPGDTTWNKGLKGVGATGFSSTRFKPGQKPANHQPMGSERIDAKDGYVYVKTAQINPHTGYRGYWRQKHVLVWEQAHGPVPDERALVFVDGDRTNCQLENLRCVHRRELCWMNRTGLSHAPAQAKDSAILIARLHLRAIDRQKGS